MTYLEILSSLARRADAFEAHIPDDWMQGRSAFGGLQAALSVAAMRQLLERDLPLRALQVTFVAPVPSGVIELTAEVLRVGSSVTQVRCDLCHDGRVCSASVGVFGADRESVVSVDPPRPEVAARPDELADMPYIEGLIPVFVKHLQLRWAQGTPPFTGSDHAESQIFARFREPGAPAESALIGLSDSIPTPALSMLREFAPASSLTWKLDVLRDPADFDDTGWALLDTRVRAGSNGYLSQTSNLWGPDGGLYAESHQTVTVFG